MQTTSSAASCGLPPSPPIQFYSVEITPLADGRVFVGVGATLCETADDAEFQLVHRDLVDERVASIEQALAVIREAVASTLLN